jgi:cystine transport system ATP-binding protein
MIGLTDIEKRFGDNLVLKGVTVTIEEGSVTALVGPSGGGKSTLLRCINLLELPTSGTVRIGDDTLEFHPGGKVPAKAIQRLRLQTGMVFQNFQLFPHRTAIENVMEGLVTVLKWPAWRARERALALLEKVGMAHKADAWPATLSAVSSNAWRSPGRWRRRRKCCCATSRPRRSIRNWRRRWSTCWASSPRRAPPW